MKGVFRRIVEMVNILSFGGVILSVAFGVLYELIGHAKFEQVLSAIGISNGFACCWILGTVMIVLLIVTSFIKEKL